MMDVHDFVSLPFNAVIIVVTGLVSTHNYRLFCLLSVCAFLIQLYLTLQPSDIGAGDGFLSLPIVQYAESESSKQLVLWLARSVASLVCSGVVWRIAYRTWHRVLIFNKEITISFLVLLFLKTLGPELSDVLSTLDVSLSRYVICSQVADALRCAWQVTYFLKRAKEGRRKEDEAGHWLTTIISVFIITQDVFNIITSKNMSWHAGADILLQLVVMADYLMHHPYFTKLNIKFWTWKKKRWQREHAEDRPTTYPPRNQQPNVMRREKEIVIIIKYRRRRKCRKRKKKSDVSYIPSVPIKERCKEGSLFVPGSCALYVPLPQINQRGNHYCPSSPLQESLTADFYFKPIQESGQTEAVYAIAVISYTIPQTHYLLGTHTTFSLQENLKHRNYVLNPQSYVLPENLNPPSVRIRKYAESTKIIQPQQEAREQKDQQLVT